MVKNEPIQGTSPPRPNSTSSIGSSGTKTEPIVEIKSNPKSSDVQFQNAPPNTENDQKMNENTPRQSWGILTLVLKLHPSKSDKLAVAWPSVKTRGCGGRGGDVATHRCVSSHGDWG